MARRPSLPLLPFHATRTRLAGLLRTCSLNAVSPADPMDDPTILPLADAATAGIVPADRAIVGPLGAPFRFALSDSQLAGASAYIAQQQRHGTHGLAPSSRRTRRADWLTWLAFCAHYDRVVLPASFDDVRTFLDQLVASGRKRATLEHMLWSLADVHRRHGCPHPMDSAVARDYWKDVLRERVDGEQVQATGLTIEMLDRLVAALHGPAGRTRRVAASQRARAAAAQHRRRVRDIAMLHVAYDLLLRASELVRMQWARLERSARGGGTYRFGKTKTDQVGVGRTLYVRPETMAALDAWRVLSAPGEHVFHAVDDDRDLDPALAATPAEAARWEQRAARAIGREAVPLSAREVGSVFRRAATLAGMDPAAHWLSGHSGRVGAAQDMVRAGSTTAQVQIAGRWASERMPIRYAERVLAQDAGEDRFARLAALRRKDIPT